MEQIIRGAEIKFQLNIAPMNGFRMSSYDFRVVAYCKDTKQKLEVTKEECTMLDDDNYIVPVDTASLGLGELLLDVYAEVPDDIFPDELRTDVARLETYVEIIV